MAKEEPQVIFLPDASNAISDTGIYISENGYPERAEKYIDKMIDFGNSLAVFPDKYPLCQFPQFSIYHLHCAVFDNTYIFVYKRINKKLVIYNVIHCKRLK